MSDRLRQEHRKKEFKKTSDAEEGREKREQLSIALRNRTRAELLHKKRRGNDKGVILIDPEPEAGPAAGADAGAGSSAKPAEEVFITPEVGLDILSDDPKAQFDAVVALRAIVSVDGMLPSDAIDRLGVVPRLVSFLGRHDWRLMQTEATWIIANLASGRRRDVVAIVNAGAIPALVPLVAVPDNDLRECAIWALANIAAENSLCRDAVFEACEAFAEENADLVKSVDFSQIDEGVFRTAAWAAAVVCRGQPPVRIVVVEAILPTVKVLLSLTDPNILSEACWALAHMTNGPCEGVETVLKAGVLSRVAVLLMHEDVRVRVPALRIVGNIAMSTDDHTAQLLNFGIVLNLARLLVAEIPSGIKDACWVFSNIVVGPRAFTDELIGLGVIDVIAGLMRSPHFEVRKEAAWTISNVVSHQVPEHIDSVVGYGCVPVFCNLVRSPDTGLVAVSMTAFENILHVDAQAALDPAHNRTARMMEEADVVGVIEELISHQTPAISERAQKMIDTYFKITDSDDVAPVAGADTYEFGVTPGAN